MEIVRGDTKALKFQRKMNGEPILDRVDKAYFTVKKNTSEDDPIFQKTINDMTFDSEGFYHFIVEPEDTNNLTYGDYVYDVEVMIGSTYKKTISRGTLSIVDEVTFPINEV